MSTIFISYRRNDSEGEAGRLADDLSRRFGEGAVFMDVDTIQPGRDFRKAIDESIRSCDVLLAVVGPEWITATDADGKLRLNDESDYVRLEIASALKRDIAVIPVMVRGARMPTVHLLPPDLTNFAYRNCVELTHARWRSDVQYLVDALQPLLEDGHPAPAPAASPNTRASGEMEAAGKPHPALSFGERTAAGAPVELDETLVHALTQELARSIGPIAPVLVKRALRRSNTLVDLLTTTANEIDGPAERKAYLAFGNKLLRTQ